MTSETAKQDRIKLEMGTWIFAGDDSDFQVFLRGLSEYVPPDAPGQISWLRRRQAGHRWPSLEFRSQRNTPGTPLISGKLLYRRAQERNSFQSSLYRMTLALSVNPTRALAHQPANRDIAWGVEPPNYPTINFFSGVFRQPSQDEWVLDGKDNIVLSMRKHVMARPPYWQEYRRRYFAELSVRLDEMFSRCLERVALASEVRLLPEFNVQEVETYWEFRTPDAIRTAFDLLPAFRSLGTSSSHRIYANTISHVDFADHTPVATCQVVTGVKLKAYAKTNRRLRIELVHDLTEARLEATAHTTNDLDGVAELIETVARSATREGNTILRALDAVLPSTSDEQRPAYEFVEHILVSASDPAAGRTLLSIIVNGNGIRLGEGDINREAVARLCDLGVLERSRPNSRYFRVAERFASARAALAQPFSSVG